MTSVAVLPLVARQLNLLGQGVEVQQQEMRQPLHSRCQLFGGWLDAVERFVPVKSKLVRPVLQGWRDAVFGRQFVDPLFDLPCVDVRREVFKRDFHAFAKHAGSGRPLMAMKAITCLDVVLSDSFRGKWRRDGRLRCRLNPLDRYPGQTANIASRSREGHPLRIVNPHKNGARTLRTYVHRMTLRRVARFMRGRDVGKAKSVPAASRAIVKE